MNKFFYNRKTSLKDLREEAFFIVIERKILITHKKVNKRAYWLVKNTPHFYLNLNLRNAQLASFFRVIFTARWIRTEKVNADGKIGQFFVGFFHILKRTKTALQLNRTETLQLV